MASVIQVRVDEELKIKADALFKVLGTDTTTAIRMFLAQAVANEGFPFEIKKVRNSSRYPMPMTEEALMMKLEASRDHSDQGLYRDADEAVAEMREKYGL